MKHSNQFIFLGFVAAVLRLCDYVEREGFLSLNWTPKLVHPTAEMLSDSQRLRLSFKIVQQCARAYGLWLH